MLKRRTKEEIETERRLFDEDRARRAEFYRQVGHVQHDPSSRKEDNTPKARAAWRKASKEHLEKRRAHGLVSYDKEGAPRWTRKDFRFLALILKSLPDTITRDELVKRFAYELLATNRRLDTQAFIEACKE